MAEKIFEGLAQMKIQGLQKLTLLDYPSKVACTIFTAGCNLRCPFCHNASLVTRLNDEPFTQEEIFSFLEKRRGVLDGVCISGGEPLLQDDIEEFVLKVKQMGFLVKIDTNGTCFDKLKRLIEKNLVDYVAMDVKNSISEYPKTTDVENLNVLPILNSIALLMENKVDYEFRTTIVKQFHNETSIEQMGKLIKGVKRLYFQKFIDSGDLITCEPLQAHSHDTMLKFKKILENYVQDVQLRG